MEGTQELESKALVIPTQAQSIVVASSADMEMADRFNQSVKAMVKEVDAVFEPLAKKAFESHRAITGKWNEIKKPLNEAIENVTRKVRGYIAEENRKKEAEEARLREVARKQEEERRLAEALELEKEGRKEEAAAIIEEPMTIVTPTVRVDVPKYDARQYRPPTPKARIKEPYANSMFLLIQWVANGRPDCQDYLLPNEKVLNAKAKSMGKAMNIPGVSYYEE